MTAPARILLVEDDRFLRRHSGAAVFGGPVGHGIALGRAAFEPLALGIHECMRFAVDVGEQRLGGRRSTRSEEQYLHLGELLEGGFDPEEREAIRAHSKAIGIALGPRILRAETAAAAAVSLWMGTVGDWGPNGTKMPLARTVTRS